MRFTLASEKQTFNSFALSNLVKYEPYLEEPLGYYETSYITENRITRAQFPGPPPRIGTFSIPDCFVDIKENLYLSLHESLQINLPTIDWSFELQSKMRPTYTFPKNCKYIKGTSLLVHGKWISSYYHFVNEAIGKLYVAGLDTDLSGIDNIFFPTLTLRYCNFFAQQFGLAERCRDIPSEPVVFEKLLLPTYPSRCGWPSAGTLAYLNEIKIPTDKASSNDKQKALYLTGRTTRKPTNEEEVINLLQKLGLEVVNPDMLSNAEQIQIFRSARLVVSPHGGALTNLAFAKDIAVIELFGSQYVNACFAALCKQLGHSYSFIICEPITGSDRNYIVDTSKLKSLVLSYLWGFYLQ